jgi:hypothetical protein
LIIAHWIGSGNRKIVPRKPALLDPVAEVPGQSHLCRKGIIQECGGLQTPESSPSTEPVLSLSKGSGQAL